uniref:Uncharacterized protein n=1 Tax=Magnetococcus massalia (strain MO-1) TaxID=451514 RepID=A0A1S7LNP4_MAGMO|nr:protein of unknown function [Candidatus Magnetococcus massalia]
MMFRRSSSTTKTLSISSEQNMPPLPSLIARRFHEGWPEGGSRPAMARRGVKWSGEHSGSMRSAPFDTATQPARSMGPHNGYPS